MALRSMILTVVAVLALAGCAEAVKAPNTTRVCYYAAQQKDKSWRFFELKRNVPQIEYCAVELERNRLQFLRLGGSNRETVGSYQGQFIFLQEEGVFFARKFDGIRYLALRRYQGRLIMPGAIQQGP